MFTKTNDRFSAILGWADAFSSSAAKKALLQEKGCIWGRI